MHDYLSFNRENHQKAKEERPSEVIALDTEIDDPGTHILIVKC